MYKNYIHAIPVSLLVLLYTYTGVAKLLQLPQQQAVLAQLPYIGGLSSFIAIAVPVAELVVVCALLIPSLTKPGLTCSLCMLVVFTTYIIAALLGNSHLPCSCGGVLRSLTWTQHIFFNSTFIVVNIIALRINRRQQTEHSKLLHA
jgi:uncharacterized membrane protein YphA (DoxX/SURF4 family)